MATFEPTDAEKATASYLDWDDAELGKFTKYIGLMLKAATDDLDGIKRVTFTSAAMMLIAGCVDVNAGTLTLALGDCTHDGAPTGDWEIVVRQTKAPVP